MQPPVGGGWGTSEHRRGDGGTTGGCGVVRWCMETLGAGGGGTMLREK